MIYASFATVLLLAQQTFASPVVKRQAASTSTVATQVVTISSANTAAPPAATNASSQASSAAYPCPSNYTAAYIETSMNFAHPASVVAAYITMFQNASYFGILNGTGGNAIGATRYLVSGNAEVLTQTTAGDPAIVGVNGFNLTNGPIRIGSTNLSTTLSNYSTVIQVVANNSVVPIGNVSTIKLFSNICAQDVNAGRTIQLMSFMGALGNIGILLNGRNLTAAITPIVTLTNTVNTTAVAATQTIASTSVVIAPTQTIQSTLLSLASTVTAVQTITPQTMTATAVQTIVPVASTLVAVTTSTPATSTQTALTTIGQDSRTVTIATTLNPSVASVTASSTVTA